MLMTQAGCARDANRFSLQAVCMAGHPYFHPLLT
jgi:hypothetical protein